MLHELLVVLLAACTCGWWFALHCLTSRSLYQTQINTIAYPAVRLCAMQVMYAATDAWVSREIALKLAPLWLPNADAGS